MTFIKQCYISFHIQNGIKLFGTNPDKFINLGGYKLPGNGAILAAIEASCHTQAEIMGKPNSYILDYIVKKDNLNKKECIMVGDSRETDIRFGNNGSIDTVCVLSGVTSE
jgi:ribonucleotide monophosphatase NagD (HAD superfamily)